MEGSISSLTFSGSIPEAITLAKNQKKLFVVYISGEDEASIRLDEALWTDLRVAECIKKYCVLLHIPEGSNDATNFSAIYPQKPSPCITAVGYTGVLLWQNDESVSPENLVSSIEKSWLSLHIQESEEFPEQRDVKMDDTEKSVSPIEAVEAIDLKNQEVCDEEEISFSDNNINESDSCEKSTSREIKGNLHDEASVISENRDLGSGVSDQALSELLLSIRLPNGTNLQDKFPKIDALRLVKDYVDRNMADFRGSYDLAIPYPRKVFKEQDLDKSLEEHGIINRQGFIVVPHQRNSRALERGSSSGAPKFTAETDASTGRIGGYFSYVRYMLSYVNPFSYLGGAASSTPTHGSPGGVQQYRPNSTIQNNISREGRQGYSDPTNSTSQRNERNIRQRTSRIGANIHTLKHEEDDVQDDKNTYWNGNSTEFGGDDNR